MLSQTTQTEGTIIKLKKKKTYITIDTTKIHRIIREYFLIAFNKLKHPEIG
jgi:hypothetical protein